jgi:hypothetical protein
MIPMPDPRDYKLDISSARPCSPEPLAKQDAAQETPRRPFLSVHFECCGVYQRIYRDPSGASYSGHCPRCGKPVRFAVGAGGTAARFFRAS